MAIQNRNSKKDETRHDLMPEIREVTVGIKEPRRVKIYPLSVPDQLDLADTITDVLSTVLDLEQKGVLQSVANEDDDSEESAEERKSNTLYLVQSLLTTLRDTIPTVVDKVFDDVSPNEISNNQLINIAFIIYEMNYQDLTKNLKDLFKKKEMAQESQKNQ